MTVFSALILASFAATGASDRAVVPTELQVEILTKVLRYDRNFEKRAGTQVQVLVVYLESEPNSVLVAGQLLNALRAQEKLGGVAHREELVAFETPDKLLSLSRQKRATVILFAPGLSAHASKLASTFEQFDGLTVSATPEGVRDGFVLGFDLVSGKPRMLLNLAQSRKQNTAFRPEVLQLMTVLQ